MPLHDLITIYYALIRSLLEYCCTVWHCGLPLFLSEQVEKIQKRALRIILPGRSYRETQVMLQCPKLDIRRGENNEKGCIGRSPIASSDPDEGERTWV